MRVFLTGGSGLIGSHVAAHLRRGGHTVVALQRPGSDTEFLRDLECEVVRGDVTDPPERLRPLVVGCTHLVHGAALVYAGGSWEAVRDVNVAGTRNVLQAGASAGVSHVVHISSVAVYGSVDGAVDEATPTDTPIPPTDFYARSKREAEGAARGVAEETGLSVSMLRPSAVYGERDRLMTRNIAGMLRWPVVFVLGDGHNAVPAVYAGNVAHAVLLALEAERDGGVWNVGLDHRVTQRRLLVKMGEGMGRRPRLVSLPAPLVRAGADVLQRVGASIPGAAHLPMGRAARLAMGENPYPSAALRRDLGWSPPYPADEALIRTGRWWREHKLSN